MSIYCKKALSNFKIFSPLLVTFLVFVAGCKSTKSPNKDIRETGSLISLEKRLGVSLPEGANKYYYEEISKRGKCGYFTRPITAILECKVYE
jgi:hypothetical protein